MEQFENITLGPRYALRLQNLEQGHMLQVTCLACDHKTLLDPQGLRDRVPGYTRITELEKKLRCQRCGNRDGNSLQVGRLIGKGVPDGP